MKYDRNEVDVNHPLVGLLTNALITKVEVQKYYSGTITITAVRDGKKIVVSIDADGDESAHIIWGQE